MQCIQYHLYMIECQCFLIRIYAARCFHMVLHAMLCMIQGKRIIVYLYFKPCRIICIVLCLNLYILIDQRNVGNQLILFSIECSQFLIFF